MLSLPSGKDGRAEEGLIILCVAAAACLPLSKAVNLQLLMSCSLNALLDCCLVIDPLPGLSSPFGETVNKTSFWNEKNPLVLKHKEATTDFLS